MIPHSIKYRSLANRTLDRLFEQVENETYFSLGLSPPLQNIPFMAATDRVAFDEQATLILSFSEIGVSYQLFSKDTAASNNENSLPVGPVFQGTGEELRLMSDPISEDLDFIIKAKKILAEQELEKWLEGVVRITVGVDVDIPVELEKDEINFGEAVRVILPNSQAGIAYSLFDDNNILIGGPIVGNEAEIIIQSGSGILEEDTTLTIRAIRDNEAGTGQALSAQPIIRVRANPMLSLAVSPDTIDYNAPLSIQIENSQSSVLYSLHQRPLEELEFWHNQTNSAPGPVSTIPISVPSPLPPDINSTPALEILSPSPILDGQIPSYFSSSGASAQGNSGNLELLSDPVSEDSLFIILAEKVGHDQPVVLEAYKFGLPLPNQNVQINVVPNPVPSGNAAEIQLSGIEPGTQYYLLDNANALLGPSVYMPKSASLIDGVSVNNAIGRLKVGVDFLAGPIPTEPLILPSPTLSSNTNFKLLAIKKQTLLSVILPQSITVQVS